MKPACGYYRVSTEDQAKGISPEMQPDKIRGYAALYEYDLPPEAMFHDDGISGRDTKHRPGVQAAVAYAIAHRATLIVYAMSRLIRNTEEGLAIHRQLRKAGAAIASVTEYIDTSTAWGRFALKMLLAKDELESDQISERTIACLQTNKTKGRRTGCVPFGYQPDLSRPETRTRHKRTETYYPHLEENPAEQAVIARIRELDHSYYERTGKHRPTFIALTLKRENVVNRRGKPFSLQSVCNLLRSTLKGGSFNTDHARGLPDAIRG